MSGPKTKGAIPQPRDGLTGEWDGCVGPGTARWEHAGTSIVAPPPAGYAWRPSVLGFTLPLGHGAPRGPLSALRRRRRPLRPSRG